MTFVKFLVLVLVIRSVHARGNYFPSCQIAEQ